MSRPPRKPSAPGADEGGQPQSMAGMVQDVTERRPADATLREAHNRITAILASIADAFYSLDDQWRRSRAPSGPMRP